MQPTSGLASDANRPPRRLRFSLAIITLNEEANIERCIRSVPFADEIVVVDSGSNDATVDIARRLKAHVVIESWRGFRDQKRLATQICSHDWVLNLDADEALSPEAAVELETLLNSVAVGEVDGYEIPRLTWNLGRWIRHGGWYPDRQLRFYDRRKALWEGGVHVHERVEAKVVGRLANSILHWPFADLAAQVETNNRYSTLGAQELVRRGEKFSKVKLIVKPLSKFAETYLVKRGFLDGTAGFVIAVGAAYSVFLKYAKLWNSESNRSAST